MLSNEIISDQSIFRASNAFHSVPVTDDVGRRPHWTSELLYGYVFRTNAFCLLVIPFWRFCLSHEHVCIQCWFLLSMLVAASVCSPCLYVWYICLCVCMCVVLFHFVCKCTCMCRSRFLLIRAYGKSARMKQSKSLLLELFTHWQFLNVTKLSAIGSKKE